MKICDKKVPIILTTLNFLNVFFNYFKIVFKNILFNLIFSGFLRPGLHGDVVTNFGLLDQIAALHWLQV